MNNIALMIHAYHSLSRIGSNWPDRYTVKGQNLLIQLRNHIAAHLQVEEEWVQNNSAQIAARQEYQL